jgi:hypothetical protein
MPLRSDKKLRKEEANGSEYLHNGAASFERYLEKMPPTSRVSPVIAYWRRALLLGMGLRVTDLSRDDAVLAHSAADQRAADG